MNQREKLTAHDTGFQGAVVLLVIIGVLLVFDASYARQAEIGRSILYQAQRQIVFALVGLLAMYLTARIPFGVMRKSGPYLVALSFVLLVVLLVIGKATRGATSWFHIGPVQFQPSEIAKIALIIFLAATLSKVRMSSQKSSSLWETSFAVGAMMIVLIVLEHDLGTAMLVTGICFAMFYAAGAKDEYIVGGALLLAILVALAIWKIPYCHERWNAFSNPWEHRFDEGLQAVHSLIAIGTGGVTGQGLCLGREKMYLPASETDYIFSTLSEECGIIGSLGILLIYGFVVYRGLDIARKSKSAFGNLLAVGVTAMIGIQTLINIAVVTNSIPATGVPLPFISYGGSSLITMMIAAGLLLSVSRQIYVETDDRAKHESSSNGRGNGRTHLSGNKRRPGRSNRS